MRKQKADEYFLVLGPFCYGKDKTLKKAMSNCKVSLSQRHKKGAIFRIYLCGPSVTFYEDGRMTWDKDQEPLELNFNDPDF